MAQVLSDHQARTNPFFLVEFIPPLLYTRHTRPSRYDGEQ